MVTLMWMYGLRIEIEFVQLDVKDVSDRFRQDYEGLKVWKVWKVEKRFRFGGQSVSIFGRLSWGQSWDEGNIVNILNEKIKISKGGKLIV